MEEIERMIRNMFQIGEISEVYANQFPKLHAENSLLAKVDLANRVTDFFPVFTFSHGFKKSYVPLRVGEQVGVFCPFGNANVGFILRGITENTKHPKGFNQHTEIHEWEDGTVFKIDLKTKKIELTTPNDLVLSCKNAMVKAEKVEVDSSDINFGKNGTGVVTKACVCAFTGNPHPVASKTVKASL